MHAGTHSSTFVRRDVVNRHGGETLSVPTYVVGSDAAAFNREGLDTELRKTLVKVFAEGKHAVDERFNEHPIDPTLTGQLTSDAIFEFNKDTNTYEKLEDLKDAQGNDFVETARIVGYTDVGSQKHSYGYVLGGGEISIPTTGQVLAKVARGYDFAAVGEQGPRGNKGPAMTVRQRPVIKKLNIQDRVESYKDGRPVFKAGALRNLGVHDTMMTLDLNAQGSSFALAVPDLAFEYTPDGRAQILDSTAEAAGTSLRAIGDDEAYSRLAIASEYVLKSAENVYLKNTDGSYDKVYLGGYLALPSDKVDTFYSFKDANTRTSSGLRVKDEVVDAMQAIDSDDGDSRAVFVVDSKGKRFALRQDQLKGRSVSHDANDLGNFSSGLFGWGDNVAVAAIDPITGRRTKVYSVGPEDDLPEARAIGGSSSGSSSYVQRAKYLEKGIDVYSYRGDDWFNVGSDDFMTSSFYQVDQNGKVWGGNIGFVDASTMKNLAAFTIYHEQEKADAFRQLYNVADTLNDATNTQVAVDTALAVFTVVDLVLLTHGAASAAAHSAAKAGTSVALNMATKSALRRALSTQVSKQLFVKGVSQGLKRRAIGALSGVAIGQGYNLYSQGEFMGVGDSVRAAAAGSLFSAVGGRVFTPSTMNATAIQGFTRAQATRFYLTQYAKAAALTAGVPNAASLLTQGEFLSGKTTGALLAAAAAFPLATRVAASSSLVSKTFMGPLPVGAVRAGVLRRTLTGSVARNMGTQGLLWGQTHALVDATMAAAFNTEQNPNASEYFDIGASGVGKSFGAGFLQGAAFGGFVSGAGKIAGSGIGKLYAGTSRLGVTGKYLGTSATFAALGPGVSTTLDVMSDTEGKSISEHLANNYTAANIGAFALAGLFVAGGAGKGGMKFSQTKKGLAGKIAYASVAGSTTKMAHGYIDASVKGEDYTKGQAVADAIGGALLANMVSGFLRGNKNFVMNKNNPTGTSLQELGSNPMSLLNSSLTGAKKWVAVSPAFTAGGSLWNGGFTMLEKAVNGDENWSDTPLFLSEGTGEALTLDELARSAVEGPTTGLWMAPAFGTMQVSKTMPSGRLGRGLRKVQQLGEGRKPLVEGIYRDVAYMPGLITGAHKAIDVTDRALAATANYIDNAKFSDTYGAGQLAQMQGSVDETKKEVQALTSKIESDQQKLDSLRSDFNKVQSASKDKFDGAKSDRILSQIHDVKDQIKQNETELAGNVLKLGSLTTNMETARANIEERRGKSFDEFYGENSGLLSVLPGSFKAADQQNYGQTREVFGTAEKEGAGYLAFLALPAYKPKGAFRQEIDVAVREGAFDKAAKISEEGFKAFSDVDFVLREADAYGAQSAELVEKGGESLQRGKDLAVKQLATLEKV